MKTTFFIINNILRSISSNKVNIYTRIFDCDSDTSEIMYVLLNSMHLLKKYKSHK